MSTLPTVSPLPGTTAVNLINSKFDSVDNNLTVGLAAKAPVSNPAFTGTVTLPGSPTLPLQAAPKSYVDAMQAGIHITAEVVAATTANITLSAPQTIDGVAVTAGQRVLVKNQTTTSQNGIYVVAAGAWTRATDLDAWSEVNGAFTFVQGGTVNGRTGWVAQGVTTGTIGTDAITWVQFSAVPTVSSSELVYETRTALMAAGVPVSVNWVQTLGYTSVGDFGGATYERVGSMPSHNARIQSGDGAWWEIRNPILSPEMLGAFGDGTTDDATALVNWHGACSVLGVQGRARKTTYRIITALSIPTTSNINIDWDGATLKIDSAATGTFLGYGFETTHGSGTIATNITKRARTVTLTAGTFLAVGRYMIIEPGFASGTQAFIGKIIGVAGAVATLDAPVPFAMATSDTYSIQIKTLCSNIRIRNLTIDGTLHTGTSSTGLVVRACDGSCEFTNIRVTDMDGTSTASNCGGMSFQYCHRTRINTPRTTRSGSSGTAAMATFHCTSVFLDGIVSEFDSGFGYEDLASSYMYWLNPRVEGSNGRAFKFAGTVSSQVTNGVFMNDRGSGVCLAISLNAQDNIFTGGMIGAVSSGSQDIGIWTSQHTNNNNTFIGLRIFSCQTYVINVSTTDVGNKFIDCFVDDISKIRNDADATFFNLNGEGWWTKDDGASGGPTIYASRHSNSPAVSDNLAVYVNRGYDDAGNLRDYAGTTTRIVTPATATYTGSTVHWLYHSGSYREVIIVGGAGINPVTDNQVGLGTNGTEWTKVASKKYEVTGNQVVGARVTGYSAFAGSADRSTGLNTGTVTVLTLAQRVKALQDDMTTHGLIGP